MAISIESQHSDTSDSHPLFDTKTPDTQTPNPEKEQAKRSTSLLNPFIQKLSNIESLNFLLTNRIPRAAATRFMGRFSRIENKLISRLSIGAWKLFVDDLNLEEAHQSSFKSMHDCFTRQLKEGARAIDPDERVVVSPCDGIIGAHGAIEKDQLYQIKGFPYSLSDLLGGSIDWEPYIGGTFATIRIKSSMYHRFHAPVDCKTSKIQYISGDTWNVNPIALKRVEKLFCKNERAVVELELDDPDLKIALVPVAAILVASMKFHGLEQTLNLDYKGPNTLDCHGAYTKGEELGYFEHGSTIVVLANRRFQCAPNINEGDIIRMGQPLLQITK